MSLLKRLGEKGKRTAVGLAMLGAVAAGAGGLSGCSTYWEATAPLWELHPEILQPGGYKDYKRQKENTVKPQWYIDESLLPNGEITDETRCILRTLVREEELINVYGKEISSNNYENELKRLNIEKCPSDFKDAFSKYITSQEREENVPEKWMDVKNISLKNGVRYGVK